MCPETTRNGRSRPACLGIASPAGAWEGRQLVVRNDDVPIPLLQCGAHLAGAFDAFPFNLVAALRQLADDQGGVGFHVLDKQCAKWRVRHGVTLGVVHSTPASTGRGARRPWRTVRNPPASG